MNDYEKIKNILIIGMSGGLANITAKILLMKYPHIKITGVDQRTPHHDYSQNEDIKFKRIRYTRGNFERLFRDHRFDAVYLLGRLTHSKSSLEDSLDLNLIETHRILDLSLKFGIKKIVVLSTYHVYGALHDNPAFIEEDSPLRASIKYPELRDVVEIDQIATNWLWKNQRKIETVVLRPATIIGPQIKNTMTRYLLTPYAPVCADFNPMFQFIHEFDMATILVRTLFEVPAGIYNVAPDECISLKEAKRVLEIPTTPVPSFLLKFGNHLAQFTSWSLPRYFMNYLRYSCIIDNHLIKSYLGEELFRYKTKEALVISKLD